jgi:hypothetical protein
MVKSRFEWSGALRFPKNKVNNFDSNLQKLAKAQNRHARAKAQRSANISKEINLIAKNILS